MFYHILKVFCNIVYSVFLRSVHFHEVHSKQERALDKYLTYSCSELLPGC